MTESTPEQQKQQQPERRPAVTGRFPYGWRSVPVIDETGNKVFGVYRKQFSHEPRTVLFGAPKWGPRWLGKPSTKRQVTRYFGAKGRVYIVWADRSVRRVDKMERSQVVSEMAVAA